jgi:5-methylcytosine-specific restriction endonuclease McrA
MHPIQAARDAGLSQYSTGKPCPKGHVSSRFVSSRQCIVCAGLRKKQWAIQNPEVVLEYNRHFLSENRESIRLRDRAWRAKNPDKVKARKKAEYIRTKDKHLARCKIYAKNNKERLRNADRIKREANPERYRAYKKNYKLRKKGARGSHTGDDILAILKAQKGKCAYCRIKVGKKYHVDHIIPLFRDGSNDRKNLQILCARCNHTKHAKDPIVFAQSLGMLI